MSLPWLLEFGYSAIPHDGVQAAAKTSLNSAVHQDAVFQQHTPWCKDAPSAQKGGHNRERALRDDEGIC
eukprot:CAMPEP_0119402094 /NCGR_PEP_ID=MMETSP1334-20130426/142705_1 /TAXON_ID=127549 /ORGANISM="Calcidiscus leptoporus, Strain RCC1130" /LENGTH=68 /DNA_ID=CAMNT_0007426021 /DNA_START=79 /DNA_END=285 /DNA_ORIENTATION=-